MDDTNVYVLHIHGQVSENEINALSPVQIRLEPSEPGETHFSACTDQSGIIALIRHLHNLGLVFLLVQRTGTAARTTTPEENQ